MNLHSDPIVETTASVATRQWTLVGSTKTGKTSFLFAALQRLDETSALQILHLPSTIEELGRRLIEQRKQSTVSGTLNAIVRYGFRASAELVQKGADWPDITLTDGPGGDLLPMAGEVFDPVRSPARTEYRTAVDASEGILLFLPHPTATQGPDMEWISRVTNFVSELAEKSGPLQRIALCISKADLCASFKPASGQSATALEFAELTRKAYRAADPNGSVCRDLRNLARRRPEVSVAVFALSAFGTVGNTGHPNVIVPFDLPLVHHLTLPEIVGRSCVPIFPRPFTEVEINSLWRPFNVNSPLRFLFDGVISDQLGLRVEDV